MNEIIIKNKLNDELIAHFFSEEITIKNEDYENFYKIKIDKNIYTFLKEKKTLCHI